jgi:hypothetical protein
LLSIRSAAVPNRDAGGFQIAADRLAPNAGRSWMRESVHPNRPSAQICCCVSLSKTLLIPARDYTSIAFVNVSAGVSQLPVFRCRLIAGFGCPPRHELIFRVT